MLTRTLYLHLGIHKTGTSAIQTICMVNRDRLMRAGILFPRAGFTGKQLGGTSETSGHRALLGFLKEPDKMSGRSNGRQLLQEIEESSCDRIIISSEVFSAPHNRDAVKGLSWFRQRGFDAKVIVYLRRQDAWLDSFYRERLKWGGKESRETRTIEEFSDAEGSEWLDYRSRLGVWVNDGGRENAVIRSYEDVQAAGGVVADFLRVVGADERLLDTSRGGDSYNLSLPPAAVELLRAFNELPAFGEGSNSDLIAAVRRMELFTQSGGSLISPAFWQKLKSKYGEENEELRRTWVSGPSERLSFETNFRPDAVAEQAISHADSALLIAGLSRAFAYRARMSRRTIPIRAAVHGDNSFGIVTTCRESPKQVREFVNYHLNLGAACVVIYFDDPADPAMKLFEQEPRVICRACNDSHWYALLGGLPASTGQALVINIEDGASILRERGVAWIVPIDADELLYSSAPFTEILAAVEPDVDVVLAKPVEAIQHKGMREGLEFSSCYFRDFPSPLTAAQRITSERHMKGVNEFGEAGCFGHLEGKSIFRASAEIDRYGVHMPHRSKKGLRRIVSDDIVLLHFDAMNYESWERKWIRRVTGETVFLKLSDRRWAQHHQIRQSYESGGSAGMKRLFREWHVYSPAAVAALRRAKLLRRIRIPTRWFARPIKPIS